MDSINDALIDAVKALGGSKQVGPLLWPEKTPDAAQRLLLACLNEDRPEHLTPEHMMYVLRLSRAKGKHEAFAYMAQLLGYAQPVPIEPRDELAELQRQSAATPESLQGIVSRMEALQNGTRHLRAA